MFLFFFTCVFFSKYRTCNDMQKTIIPVVQLFIIIFYYLLFLYWNLNDHLLITIEILLHIFYIAYTHERIDHIQKYISYLGHTSVSFSVIDVGLLR